VEAGKTEVRPVRLQVANLFGTLRGMMKPLLVNDAVNLIFEEPRGIPPLITDESKLAQILRNFVSNALKFTERGEVRVSARLSEDGTNIIFAVCDTGIGIAAEDLERIFHEFEQLDNPIQKRVRGTGLGLPLAKKLAELLGGRVTVESMPGRGSTFYATIPAVVQTPGSTLTNKVLIIDDEEVSRYLLRQSLALPAFQVIEASGGEEGLRRARQELPRAILLDLRMPGMTGFEVLKQLKADQGTAAIPVIIVTSRSMTVEERSFLDQNADGILSKDFLTGPDAGEVIRRVLLAAGVQLESEPAEAGKA
jgi:CheY-like chemotaxis protein